MLKAIIIDDETAAIGALSKKLELYCTEVSVIGTYESAKDGLLHIKSDKPDIVFLDIEMPWMNGFELLMSLGDEIDFAVVFVTAYDQYAVKAFKVKAQDFLLKPVDKDDLIACVNSITKQREYLNAQKIADLILESNRNLNTENLVIHSKDSIDVIKKDDISHIKAESNYSQICTIQGDKFLASKTLNHLDTQLNSSQFIRVHRSFTVNIKHIIKLDTSEGLTIVLSNQTTIPVSRRKKEDVILALS